MPLDERLTVEAERGAAGVAPLLADDGPRRRRRGMTLKETLTLSPYQKWRRYGQLPTKLM